MLELDACFGDSGNPDLPVGATRAGGELVQLVTVVAHPDLLAAFLEPLGDVDLTFQEILAQERRLLVQLEPRLPRLGQCIEGLHHLFPTGVETCLPHLQQLDVLRQFNAVGFKGPPRGVLLGVGLPAGRKGKTCNREPA